MQLTIREPGSAITHFIGCLMALIAASPLLIKAHGNATYMLAMTIFATSMVLLYAASTIYHSICHVSAKVLRNFQKLDHMMIFVLIAGSYTPVCMIILGGRIGYTLLALVWGNCSGRNHYQRTLDHLSEMVFFHHLHCHGLDVPASIYPAVDGSPACRIWLAFSGRHHLHHRWCNLCSETSGI